MCLIQRTCNLKSVPSSPIWWYFVFSLQSQHYRKLPVEYMHCWQPIPFSFIYDANTVNFPTAGVETRHSPRPQWVNTFQMQHHCFQHRSPTACRQQIVPLDVTFNHPDWWHILQPPEDNELSWTGNYRSMACCKTGVSPLHYLYHSNKFFDNKNKQEQSVTA